MAEEDKPAIKFESLNPTGSRTLLLLPGMYCSHHEFHLLSTPHFQEYHLLLPDFPRHGRSAEINVPFNLPSIAALLAELIVGNAKNGRANVCGGDLGGYAALYLASRYPERVSSVFITGCERDYSSSLYSNWVAAKTYLGAVLGMVLLPRSWLELLLKKLNSEFNDELYSDMRQSLSWYYTYGVFRMLSQDWGTGKEVCEKLAARTLFIAAGRQDNVKNAQEKGAWIGSAHGEGNSKAAVVHEARHAWTLQVGKVELLARGIKAWIEDENFPAEYEILEGVH